MPVRDELSSTENLLEAVRAGKAPSGKIPEGPPPSAPKRDRTPLSLRIPIAVARKKISIGIDFGPNTLRMVKVHRSSHGRCALMDYRSVPYQLGTSWSDPNFTEFLRASVTEFAAPTARYALWTMVPSGNVDVRRITIPKVRKSQIAGAVQWTLKKEGGFSEKESVLDFELQDDVMEKGVAKTEVTACLAPVQEVRELKRLFTRAGLKLCGITVPSFAMQNLFRSECLFREDHTVAALWIGRRHSRIDIFSKGYLVLTRGIKTGIDSMVDSLAEEMDVERKAPDTGSGDEETLDLERRTAEPFKDRGERESCFLGLFRPDGPCEEWEGPALDEEAAFEAIQPALDRLVRQVDRTLEHHSAGPAGEKVELIYIASEAGHWERLFQYIGAQLGLRRQTLDPMGREVPWKNGKAIGSEEERMPFTATVGLALSETGRTPNLIFNYRDRAERATVARIDRGIFSAFLVSIVVLAGIFFWQMHLSSWKVAEIAHLLKQLYEYGPPIEEPTIMDVEAKIKKEQLALKEWSDTFLGIAVIGDLAALTPSNVKLLGIKATLEDKPEGRAAKAAPAAQAKGPAQDKKDESPRNLVVEGIVVGARETLESSLAGYLMKLSRSPLFVNPTVNPSAVEPYPEGGEMLRFSLRTSLP